MNTDSQISWCIQITCYKGAFPKLAPGTLTWVVSMTWESVFTPSTVPRSDETHRECRQGPSEHQSFSQKNLYLSLAKLGHRKLGSETQPGMHS